MVGKLRNKIDILNFSTISNGSGGLIEAWRIDKSVFASITPTSGFRGLEASQIGLNQTYKIIIRYEDYPILSRVNKIQFENRILIIHEYKTINERRQYIEIRCEEDAGQDVIIYDENFQPITDQNGNYLTT